MGKRTSFEAGTFSWIDLATTDQEGAKAFYRTLFGWEYDDRDAGNGVIYSMALVDGAPAAAISPLPPDEADQGIPPHWNNYVTVTSADDAAPRAAELGGQILAEPFDVLEAGRMAVIADPAGAVLALWEPRSSIGAEIVNEPGTLTWNDLSTNDLDGATGFYGGLFGWTFEEVDTQGGPRYILIKHGGAAGGRNGGMREMGPEEPFPPNWMPYFVSESVNGTVASGEGAGGRVVTGPIDLPSGRMAVLQDPQGAVFGIVEGETDD